MKRILAPILLITFLFPSLAQGQSLDEWIGKGKGYLCETTGVGCPESVDFNDLVKRDGLYFKKRTDVPFTGITTGDEQGLLENGNRVGPWVRFHPNGQLWERGTYKNDRKEGLWVTYWSNGQLQHKGTYKDGKEDGPWVSYQDNGTVWKRFTGTYKNGVKVK